MNKLLPSGGYQDRVQLASNWLSKNFPLMGCPVNLNEAEVFFA